MGVPSEHAVALSRTWQAATTAASRGTVPALAIEATFLVCADCAARVGLQVARLPQVMRYEHPGFGDEEEQS